MVGTGVLGSALSMNKIVVDMRRMGGGFGGKETQAASPAGESVRPTASDCGLA